MKRALIVADIQNDFLPGGALAVPEGDSIIPFVIGLIQARDSYDLIVAVQDWHPPNHGSFASAHPGAKPFDLGSLAGLPQVFWPDHCVEGTNGACLAEEIAAAVIGVTESGGQTILIKKGQDPEIDSYSAFFDNARRRETGLDKALRRYEIEALDVVGLAFDYCVKATALDGASLGFRTRVLLQGTRAIDKASVALVRKELENAGVSCVG